MSDRSEPWVPWEAEFLVALVGDDVAGMLAAVESQRTGHAGTAPAKIKVRAVRRVMAACRHQPGRQLALGLALARSASETGQEMGAVLLGEVYTQDPAAVASHLLTLADSPNWEVREWAAQGIAGALVSDFPAFYPTLVTWVGNPAANVRRAVALAAMYAAQPEHPSWAAPLLDLVEPLLPDRDEYVRKNLGPFAIGDGLLRRYPQETLARLAAWATRDDEQVRWNVAMAFSAAAAVEHAAAAVPILQELLQDPRAYVARAARKAWQNLARRAPEALQVPSGSG
jgi:hypothetical protein